MISLGESRQMSEMDVKALQANFEIWKHERASGLPNYKAFERYAFEQVLKDYEPADEDLDIGPRRGNLWVTTSVSEAVR
jgi:hypothetical protein